MAARIYGWSCVGANKQPKNNLHQLILILLRSLLICHHPSHHCTRRPREENRALNEALIFYPNVLMNRTFSSLITHDRPCRCPVRASRLGVGFVVTSTISACFHGSSTDSGASKMGPKVKLGRTNGPYSGVQWRAGFGAFVRLTPVLPVDISSSERERRSTFRMSFDPTAFRWERTELNEQE